MKIFRYDRFITLLLIGVLAGMAACSSSRNSIENIPRQVLLSSSEGLMVAGKQIVLTADLSSDFSQSSSQDEALFTARVEISTSDGTGLPGGLDTDAVWVMVDDQVWGSSYTGEQFQDDPTRIVKIARGSPEYETETIADVVVRIHHGGKSYLLKETGVEISKSE